MTTERPQTTRRCEATTKAGKPCRSAPLDGQPHCISHSDSKTQERLGFGIGGGRPRKPTSSELFEQWWNEHEGAVLAALDCALHADKAIVVGNGPKARLEYAPDYELRLKAARELMDRRHGRPKQAHEVTTPESKVDEEIARLLRAHDERDRAAR